MAHSCYKDFFASQREQFVFPVMDFTQSLALLRSNNKRWLLRFSHVEGMIAIDFFSKNKPNGASTYLALVKRDEGLRWITVPNGVTGSDLQKWVPLNNINIDQNECIPKLLQVLERSNFSSNEMLCRYQDNCNKDHPGYTCPSEIFRDATSPSFKR